MKCLSFDQLFSFSESFRTIFKEMNRGVAIFKKNSIKAILLFTFDFMFLFWFWFGRQEDAAVTLSISCFCFDFDFVGKQCVQTHDKIGRQNWPTKSACVSQPIVESIDCLGSRLCVWKKHYQLHTPTTQKRGNKRTLKNITELWMSHAKEIRDSCRVNYSL